MRYTNAIIMLQKKLPRMTLQDRAEKTVLITVILSV